MVQTDKIKPTALVDYLEDGNAMLFDTDVIGAEVYKSDNDGKSWQRTHTDFLDDVFYTYGYYFAQIAVSPINPDHIYILGVPILKSKNGGKTFESISGDNVHADHHALWINPKKTNHLLNGNDGGLNISYDDGKHWRKCNAPAVGQFYAVAVDMETPYNVYGGLQDNGVWVGSSSINRVPNGSSRANIPTKNCMEAMVCRYKWILVIIGLFTQATSLAIMPV
jgi:hypothetical protein